MGESNDSWGNAPDDQTAAQWDRMQHLPDKSNMGDYGVWAGTKGLTIADLARIGTRYSPGDNSLIWLFPDGFKYRNIELDKRWSQPGVKWAHHKMVHAPGTPDGVIVAEGETDGAWLKREFPTFTIAIMPAGAGTVTPEMIQELSTYTTIYIGTDNDVAGEAGAKKYLEALPQSRRILPPYGTDWCEWGPILSHVKDGMMPLRIDEFVVEPEDVLADGHTFMATDLGTREDNQWFGDPICQVKGQTVIHGKKKSLKSMIALELVRALATGTAFAGYVPFIHPRPARVAVVQFEVPPFSFQERLTSVLRSMPQDMRPLFLSNVYYHSMQKNRMPRMKTTDKNFLPSIQTMIQATSKRPAIDVILFDPIQRMTGVANQSQSHEMEALLDACAVLQNDGLTTIMCHHNNKASGKSERDSDSMTGTQRFSGDADSICSVWYDPAFMVDDHNDQRTKQRNFDWTLRSGVANGRAIEVRSAVESPALMDITYREQFVSSSAEAGPEF